MVGQSPTRSKMVLLSLYKSLVRPHLEYCCPGWSPQYEKDKALLERVQHRFFRMVPGLSELSYEERLQLRIWSSEERRNKADLIEVFNISRGLSKIPFNTFFEVSQDSRTRGNVLKMVKHRQRLDIRKHFFAERAVNRRNKQHRLSQKAVEQQSLNGFKNELTRLGNAQMDFYMD